MQNSVTDIVDETYDANISFGEQVKVAVAEMVTTIEGMAARVATSRSAFTERGLPHVAYCNGAQKRQGEMALPWPVTPPYTIANQVAAMRECVRATMVVIVAEKPDGADLLVWREEPWVTRLLRPDGLHVRAYTRLAWDCVGGAA